MSRAPAPTLKLHAIERRSRANGPGVRFALWVQGCSLGCPGCFNPETHAPGGPTLRVVDAGQLAREIAAEGDAIEGVTVSGGEPFEQPEGLLALVRALRRDAPRLSIAVFSGYARREIERTPLGPAILAELDILVDGRYVERRRVARGLRGSANQVVHILSDRVRAEEVEATPAAEVTIGPDGTVRFSGVDPVDLEEPA